RARPRATWSSTSSSRSRVARTAWPPGARPAWGPTPGLRFYARKFESASALGLGRLFGFDLARKRVLETHADALGLLHPLFLQRGLQPLVTQPHRPDCAIRHRIFLFVSWAHSPAGPERDCQACT